MFQRFKNLSVYNNVYYFAAQPGVTFSIHVYYTEEGESKVMVLAPPLNKTSLLNVAARDHPDQAYLRLEAVATKLALLEGKTITKVEVDDTISFCGTGDGQCGKVVPDWVREKFPGIPARLFVHKSDVVGHTLSGLHSYNLYDLSSHEQWEWVEIAPVAAVAAPRYVAVYTCNRVGCSNQHREKVLIEVPSATANGRTAFSFLRQAQALCDGDIAAPARAVAIPASKHHKPGRSRGPVATVVAPTTKCRREYEYRRTRLKAVDDEPLVTLD